MSPDVDRAVEEFGLWCTTHECSGLPCSECGVRWALKRAARELGEQPERSGGVPPAQQAKGATYTCMLRQYLLLGIFVFVLLLPAVVTLLYVYHNAKRISTGGQDMPTSPGLKCCADCLWVSFTSHLMEFGNRCQNPRVMVDDVSVLANSREGQPFGTLCFSERQRRRGACGLKGRLWEPRQDTRPAITQ